MGDSSFEDELQCLLASYSPSEFSYSISSQSPILKFYLQWNMTVTLEVPRSYPQDPPFISLSSTELTNTERCHLESELRNLASKNVGFPVIMDLVTKMQHLVEDFYSKKIMTDEKQTTQDKGEVLKCSAKVVLCPFTCQPLLHSDEEQSLQNYILWLLFVAWRIYDSYLAVITIDHMRQKKKYSDLLASWASEFNIGGCLLFYQKWIFLVLESCKKHIKEFMMRHRTVCVDVDSSGKPCKEKMSKVLYESKVSQSLPPFSVKEMTSIQEIENYFIAFNLQTVFEDVIKPVFNKGLS